LPVRDRGRVWQPATVRHDRGRTWLEFADPGDCERCARGDGCGAALFARLFRRGSVRLPWAGDAIAPPGATVDVGVPARWLLQVALGLYLLPVIAFVTGAVVADALAPGRDVPALLLGMLAAGTAAGLYRYGPLRPAPPPLTVRHAEARLESGGPRMHVSLRRD
jgi:positive regulator of sigma E activity